jgi:C4-dicarboxylate-specific signal transduction histidine kinase
LQHQADLAHVLRLGTIGEMTAGLAHEINQPLGAIANYAQGMRATVARRRGEPRCVAVRSSTRSAPRRCAPARSSAGCAT